MNASAVLHASLLNSYIYPAENQFLSLSQAVLEHLDPAKFPLPEPFPYKVRCLRIHPVTRQAYTLVCMHSIVTHGSRLWHHSCYGLIPAFLLCFAAQKDNPAAQHHTFAARLSSGQNPA